MIKLKFRAFISLVLIFSIILVFFTISQKPLKNLNPSEVASIEALAQPPNEAKHIDKREDIFAIVGKLREIVVYSRVKQNNTNGQIITYTLNMKDGSKREFIISPDIVVLDGVFYRTMFTPARDLSDFYDKLNYTATKQ